MEARRGIERDEEDESVRRRDPFDRSRISRIAELSFNFPNPLSCSGFSPSAVSLDPRDSDLDRHDSSSTAK